jgi:hypothetical protein
VFGLEITNDSKQSGLNLLQLNDDLSKTDYIDGLVDAFIEWWNMYRFKRRSGCSKPK